jgi:hypothetical protein
MRVGLNHSLTALSPAPSTLALILHLAKQYWVLLYLQMRMFVDVSVYTRVCFTLCAQCALFMPYLILEAGYMVDSPWH